MEELCLCFLNAVFLHVQGEPIKLIRILENRIISPEVLDDKGSVLDVLALTDKGERINIEVQLKDLHNMSERTLYYWAREYVSGIKAGQDYASLPRVVTINIVDFDHVKLEQFHSVFRLREDKNPGYILTEVLEIHFLNMVRFRKLKAAGALSRDPLERWMLFFDERTPESELMEVIKMDTAIEKAQKRMEEVTQDRDFMREYTRRMKATCDWTTSINTALEKGMAQGRQEGMAQGIEKGLLQGIEKGMAQGRQEGLFTTATALKKMGMPAEQITLATGLTPEQIAEL